MVRDAYSRVRDMYPSVRYAYSGVRDAYSRVRDAYCCMRDAYSLWLGIRPIYMPGDQGSRRITPFLNPFFLRGYPNQGWQEPRLPDFAIPAEATYNLEIVGNSHVKHGTETPPP